MDIRIVRVYYSLKLLDDRYHIYVRDEIVGPTRSIGELGITFDTEEEAKKCVDTLNRTTHSGCD